MTKTEWEIEKLTRCKAKLTEKLADAKQRVKIQANRAKGYKAGADYLQTVIDQQKKRLEELMRYSRQLYWDVAAGRKPEHPKVAELASRWDAELEGRARANSD